jgi:hypothetical protein
MTAFTALRLKITNAPFGHSDPVPISYRDREKLSGIDQKVFLSGKDGFSLYFGSAIRLAS